MRHVPAVSTLRCVQEVCLPVLPCPAGMRGESQRLRLSSFSLRSARALRSPLLAAAAPSASCSAVSG